MLYSLPFRRTRLIHRARTRWPCLQVLRDLRHLDLIVQRRNNRLCQYLLVKQVRPCSLVKEFVHYLFFCAPFFFLSCMLLNRSRLVHKLPGAKVWTELWRLSACVRLEFICFTVFSWGGIWSSLVRKVDFLTVAHCMRSLIRVCVFTCLYVCLFIWSGVWGVWR